MKANQRGNAMLISAILVFGLTVTALGVSRMLVKGTQGMATQREFLGVQAHQICEAAIWRWMRDDTLDRSIIPATREYSDFLAGRTGGGADATVTAGLAWVENPPGVYKVVATASVTNAASSSSAARSVTALAECPATGSCTAWAFTEWTP